MPEDRRTYAGHRLLGAARGVLDEDGDPRVAAAITEEGEHVTIDWAALEGAMFSSTERARLEIARSLLDGTPVKLSAIASFGSDTYGLLMRSLARGWPDPPPDIDELLRLEGLREIPPPERPRRADDSGEQ